MVERVAFVHFGDGHGVGLGCRGAVEDIGIVVLVFVSRGWYVIRRTDASVDRSAQCVWWCEAGSWGILTVMA